MVRYDMTRPSRRLWVATLVAFLGAVAAGDAPSHAKEPEDVPKVDAKALSVLVQSFDKEAIKAIIVYCSGERKFEIVDKQGETKPARSE